MATSTTTAKKPPITTKVAEEPKLTTDDLKQEIPEKKPLTPTDKKLAEDLTQIYATIGLAIHGIGSVREDVGLSNMGMAVIQRAETLSENWLELANTNPAIKKALKKITEGGAWGSLIIGHAICIVPFLADRGVIPPAVAEMIK